MNDNKLPQFIIDGLKPIIDMEKRILEIILELMPEYYKVQEIEDHDE